MANHSSYPSTSQPRILVTPEPAQPFLTRSDLVEPRSEATRPLFVVGQVKLAATVWCDAQMISHQEKCRIFLVMSVKKTYLKVVPII